MSIFTTSKKNFVKLELKGIYRDIGNQVLSRSDLSPHKYFRFDYFYEQVERIVTSESVKRVIIQRWSSFSVPVFGALEEIRTAIQRLRKAGKEVYYYAPEYNTSDCFLASACNFRVLHPLGTVSFLGRSISSVFFRKLFEKHGIETTVIRRERYKGAADSFRTEKYDEYARKQYQELLDGLIGSMRKVISDSSGTGKKEGFSKEKLDEMLAGRIYMASEALETGLVDELNTIDDLTNQWNSQKFKGRQVKIRSRYGKGPHVAILVFEGMIVEGNNARHPVFGQAIGDRPMIRLIRKVRKNRFIKAVIFRINSQGGSAVASENILRELDALNRVKPVIISMGPVAGSGGYWISGTGRRLFALPTTLTGSIGVLALFFNISGFLNKYGLTTDSIKHGDSADLGSAYRSLTDREKKMIDENIGFLYGKFLDHVAKARKLSREKVHDLGQGRLWLGNDAAGHGLVDQAGGLYDAMAYVKEILGKKSVRFLFLPRQPFFVRLMTRQGAATDSGHTSHIFTSLMRNLSLKFSGLTWQENNVENEPIEGMPGIFTSAVPLALVPFLKACLSVHGEPLLMDPVMIDLMTGSENPAF